MNILEKLLSFIKKLLKKILDIIKKIIPYILLACAIWLSLGMAITLPYFGTVIAGSTANALLVAGASFILAPSETAELIARATDGIGEAAKDVLGTVVEVAGSVAGDILSQPVVLVGLGLLALWFFTRRKDDEQQTLPNPETATIPATPVNDLVLTEDTYGTR